MSQKKLEQKSTSADVLPTPNAPDEDATDTAIAIDAIKDLPMPPAIMSIVAEYNSDLEDTGFRPIVRKAPTFFLPETHVREFLQAAVNGEPGNVKAMLRKAPKLFLEKVSEFTVPCGNILFDVSPLQALLFYQDGHMLIHDILPIIKELPIECIHAVHQQCLQMQGGGADLVKMTQDPRTVPFKNILQFIEDDIMEVGNVITYPLLENMDGIVFWDNQFFYVNRDKGTDKGTVTLIIPKILPNQKGAFDTFIASLKDMVDNSSRRSSNVEYELIKCILGQTLERTGILYCRGADWYQDIKVGNISNAYRRYQRLSNKETLLAIGMEQSQSIPRLQRMCEEKPFYPLEMERSFKEDPFNRSLQFANCNKNDSLEQIVLGVSNLGLGHNFSLCKSARYGAWSAATKVIMEDDLKAFCLILKVEQASITNFVNELSLTLEAAASLESPAPAGFSGSF